MTELVTIPVSFFELAIDYERPMVKLLSDHGSLIQGVFDALSPWNPGIDDIVMRTTGKHSEQGVTFKIPLKGIEFFVGPASCRFLRDSVAWSLVGETMTILETALSALATVTGVALSTMNASVGMHLQPRSMKFVDILKPFLSHQLAGLEPSPVRTMAIVAKWEKRRVTLDGSGVVANAVFIRFEREFESGSAFSDMAAQLRADQDELLGILGVAEDQA
jgi:hypothetical protein